MTQRFPPQGGLELLTGYSTMSNLNDRCHLGADREGVSVSVTPPTFHEIMGRIMTIMGLAWAEPELQRGRESACPHLMYAGLQQRGAVRQLDESGEFYSLYTMADVLYATRHHSVEQGSKYLGSDRPAIPLGLDGPIHKQYRHLIDPIFTAKRVAPLAERVRSLAHELIDGFIDDGHVNVHHEWCEPLPATIFLSVMGLPLEDLDNFLKFKTMTLSGGSSADLTDEQRLANQLEAITWIQSYFNASLDEREREPEPRDDIIGQLLSAEVDGHRLTRQDVLDILGLFMIAGLDTVAASLACMLSFFARNPDQRQMILDDRSLMRSAVEELMRFESPVTEGFRIATEEITLPSGTTIPAGGWMHISWSAANLDPAVFDDPLTPNLRREPNPHIGFASGFHRCLGSHLARMELVTALDAWHDRIPHYRIGTDEPLRYTGNPRAPHELPLAW
jgi:cytochrome P450